MALGPIIVDFDRHPETFKELAEQSWMKRPTPEQVIEVLRQHTAQALLFEASHALFSMRQVEFSTDHLEKMLQLCVAGIAQSVNVEGGQEKKLKFVHGYRALRQVLQPRFDIEINKEILES